MSDQMSSDVAPAAAISQMPDGLVPAVVVLFVTTAAGYLTARRAFRVDPMVAVRVD